MRFQKGNIPHNKGRKLIETHQILRRCKNCGKIFNTYKSQDAKFCSSICAGNNSLPIGSYRKSVKYDQYLEVKTENGWKLEHRLVMEKHLGRKLEKWEEVHHIDGDKHNNKLSNLFLVDKKGHSRKQFELFIKVQKLEWENKWLTIQLAKFMDELWRLKCQLEKEKVRK